MPTFSKEFLTGGTANGRQTKVAATATAGTLIHTVPALVKYELTVFAQNSSTSPVKLTIEWGGVTSPDDLIEVTIPPESGLLEVIPKLVLGAGLVVRAFAATGDVILISGYVNRITP